MASSFFTLSFCFLVLCHVCAAQFGQQTWQGPQQQQQQQQQQQLSQRRFRDQSECGVQSLSALEPYGRFESEAGVTEYWDDNNQQFECAGVSAIQHIIQPRGLLLPSFSNAPRLVYIVQGRGIVGAIIPGCPETYQSIQQSQKSPRQRGQRSTDQHQKIREFRQGDIIALPAGVAHWCYNDGETPLVAVVVHDTSSQANQLDRNLRRFQIAGSLQRQTTSWSGHQGRPGQQQSSTNNIFGGFDVETLAEAFGVSIETARKLQQQDDRRGHIVNVEGGLRVVRPSEEEEEQQQQEWRINGLEETLCSMRLKENIADPSRADVYSPKAGHINSLNSQKLPVLSMIQMSAERGVLYRNAIQAPYWNLNAHSVIYVTRGNGRVQIVGNSGRAAYDGEVQQGQILVVPQNFAVVKQAGSEGFEWVSFKTNDNAMTSPLVGKTSAIRAMPTDVLMNAYRISRDEANRLKYNRGDEMVILSPGSRSLQGGRVASA